jgi:hypothetical protein
MRVITTILFFFFVHKLHAATYYVSNAGSDANNGTSAGTSWQTINKINGFSFSDGDTIKLKCGDTWIEKLLPQSNVYYTSYSTGDKPLISGFATASFGSPTANVYTATVSNSVTNQTTVLLNGAIAIKARYPNSTYLVYSNHTTTSLTTSLTGTPSYVGKQVVAKTAHWIIDTSNVTNQSTGTLTLSPALTYGSNLGTNGFFFQNDDSFLDTANEYTYDKVNKILKVYSSTTPTAQYSIIDTLVWVSKKTNITIDGINFSGANRTAFQIDTSSYITIKNSSINNCGSNGITAYKTHHTLLQNDSVFNCLNVGVYMRSLNPTTPMIDTCNNTTITNCYLKKIALYAGMGKSGNETYMGITIMGDTNNIINNTLDSITYIGIKWNGRKNLIKNNYVTNIGYAKDDGGGIYAVIGTYLTPNYSANSIVRGNIVGNCFASKEGTDTLSAYNSSPSCGIYLDDSLRNVLVDSNTTFNTYMQSFNLREPTYITARGNLFDDSIGYNIQTAGNAASNNNNTFSGNIYYQRNASLYTVITENSSSIVASDSNYYVRPVANNSTLIKVNATNYSLASFQSATGFDTHSGIAPSTRLNDNGRLHYNPTSLDSTITLNNTYIDVYGTIYRNQQPIIMKPYKSILLFRYQYNYSTSSNLFIGR